MAFSGSLTSLIAFSTILASPIVQAQEQPAPEVPDLPAQVRPYLGNDSETEKIVGELSSSAGRVKQAVDKTVGKVNVLSPIQLKDVDQVQLGAPEGIDISSHQHSGEQLRLSSSIPADGLSYVFVKATEGTGYVNPHFRSDTVDVINSNIPVGFYHYAKPTADPEDARRQARHFVAVTGINQGVKSLPPVLDLEENEKNLSPEQLIAWTQAFVDEIKVLANRDVMMYTYPSFWRNEMGNTSKFSNLPLWIAHYHGGAVPDVPGGWTNWTFWQYTDSGRVEGYSKKVDRNYFNGNVQALQAIYS